MKVRERNHAGQQRDTSPPEVRCPCATQMPVHALVGHDRPEKDEISPKENVEDHENGIGDWEEE